eukprot:COSAG02_NODE_5529_length_4252_cov_7.756080_4_plen_42_part_00
MNLININVAEVSSIETPRAARRSVEWYGTSIVLVLVLVLIL